MADVSMAPKTKKSILTGESIDKIAIHWIVMDDTEDTFD
jgi:hypothetical protein